MSDSERIRHSAVEITINDGTLDLAFVDDLAKTAPIFGEPVIVSNRWLGPASGGPGWGPPEIAVTVFFAEIIRRLASDTYKLTKEWVLRTYSDIRPRSMARSFFATKLAIQTFIKEEDIEIYFCFPHGMTVDELSGKIEQMEHDLPRMARIWGRSGKGRAQVWLRWDVETGDWKRADVDRMEFLGESQADEG